MEAPRAHGKNGIGVRGETATAGCLQSVLGKGGVDMGNDERTSFMMLFCALMLVRKERMQLKDLSLLFPFTGEAQSLVQRLTSIE